MRSRYRPVKRAPLLPLGQIFADPEKTAGTIAPDGSMLAHLAPEEGWLNVWVRSTGGGQETCVTHDHRRGIQAYWWSQDSTRVLFLQDQDGDEKFHLFSAEVAEPSAPSRDLTPARGAKADLLALPPRHPGVAVVVLNARASQCFDAFRLDVATGQMRLVAENPGNVSAWIPDVDGRVLGALATRDDGDVEVLVRSSEDAPFRTLGVWGGEDLPFPVPGRAPLAGFTPEEGALWLASSAGADRLRLVQVDIATGVEAVLDADEEADVSAVVRHPHTGELLAACYQRDRAVIHPLHSGFSAVVDRIRHTHDGDPVSFSADAAARRWVVSFQADREPGATYLLDVDTGAADLLFRSRPWLDPSSLAPVQPVTVRSRDGFPLSCHLTLPLGVEPRRLPAVLLVHGGPWARDTWR